MRHLLILLALMALATLGVRGQSPGGASTGLGIWLKANSGPEKSAGVPAANGDAITNWLDKSGLSHHYPSVAGPTLRGSAVNFNPMVEITAGGFDGPVGSELANDYTLFFISKKLASDQDGRVFDGHSGNYLWAHWGTFTNSIYTNGNPSNYNSGIATTTGIQNLHLHSFKRASGAGTVEARADGTSLTTFGTSNTANGIRIDINQGAFSGTEASNSQIGEMIMYTSTLTATDVNKVESYLAIKYGMTIAHDYLASDGTTIWNATTNAAYQNNVTGVGRDDASALDQEKSLSINPGATMTMDKGGVFGTDKSFIVWGNDSGSGTSANVALPYGLRSGKIWKTGVVGTPGNVTVSIDLSLLSFPNTGNPADYALLKDTDTNFSSGATPHTTGASLVGSVLSFTGVSLVDGNFLSIGVANVTQPGGAIGLSLWLKANSGPEKSVGVPAASGDAVTNWVDKSGLGHSYAAVAGPTLQGSAVNFNPTVEILSGGFDAPAGSELSNDWTVFFISKKLPADQDGRLFDGHAGNFLWAHWGLYTNSIYLNNVPSNYNSGIATTTGIQNLHLHTYKRESVGGTLEARADGTSLTTFGSSNSANGVRIDINQGANSGESSTSQVGEMIHYNTALSATDVSKVESYLAIKYGMTIAHDYLASDGATIWNSTTNAAYQNNVTGIGRDDASALDQEKSLSIHPGASVTMDKGGVFGTDKSFIVWGNNLTSGPSLNIPATYSARSGRIWKVGVKGTPGPVSFSVNLATIGFPNTGSAADYALLKDTDTDFSSGTTAVTSGVSLVGSTLSFTGVNFSDGDFFSIAAANVTIPGGIVGSVFWVKADAGVIAAPDVSNWKDQSGTVNDATQPVAGQQPSPVNSIINFHPVVDFSGNTDVMATTTPPANLNSTIFTVAMPTVNTSWRTMFRGVVNDHPLIVLTGGTTLGYYDADNGGFRSGGFNWLQNEPAVVELEMRTGDVNFRKNGTQGASINTINLAGLNLDYFGNYQGGGQQFGRIAETIIYNTAAPLTTTEKQKIESYLAVKYGITLTHDYLASDGTIIWDATTNAAYPNNITGIGRDDLSALDQRKSMSVNAGAAVTIDKGGALATNKNFLLWGDDLGTGTSLNISASYSLRTNRIWKAAVTGAPGAVNFSIDLSTISFPNTGSAANYALLKDTDTDFSSGSTAVTTGASLVGSVLSFTGVTFSNGDFFTIAASNISLPGGIPGAVFWVKADAGVIAAPDVSTWTDQTGLGNDAKQPTPSQQPSPVNSIINFHPVVDFSGNTDVMATTIAPANLNSTIFTVAMPTVNTNWRTMFRGTVSDHPLIVLTGGTTLGYYDADNGGFRSGGFTWLQNEPAVVGLEMRTGDVNFRKNGAQGASINTINLAGLNLDYFGNYQVGGQQFGRIAETIIYNTPAPLTATEKQKIESYLAVKYGVTLTHDYLASDGTITWSVTTNATYSNNITGIGRDDASSLDQRKSMSVNAGAAVTIDKAGALATNKNFLIWGDDLGTGTSLNVSSSFTARTARVWKAAVTGAPGVVTFTVDLAALSFPNTGSAADYTLLKDTDTDFSSGSVALGTGTSLVGSLLTIAGINFSNGDLFTLAASNVGLPGGVSGSVFWVKADAGITAAPDVSIWADQSGTGNNATQPIAGQQPSPVNSVINFHPVVDFSGTTDVMAPTTSPTTLNSTIFTVALPTINTNWRTMFRAAVSDHPLIILTGGTTLGYYDSDNGGFRSGGFTWLQNEPAVVELEMRTGDVNFRKNGVQGASINTINLAGQNLDFFGNYQLGNQQFGRIAEAIIYNTPAPLTATDKQKVETYLGVKYGITIAHDYLASDATVVWNSTTNATFHNNVAGVGRDDATAQDQRKSKSVNAGAVVTVDKGGAFGTNKSYLIWGDNNGAMDASGVFDVPPGVLRRIARVWKLGVIGNPGVVTIQFDLSTVFGAKTASDLRLLVDRNKNGLFADETVGGGGIISGAVNLGGGVFQFAPVTFNDGESISIGSASLTTPLPISLVAFDASMTDDVVKLTWTTASEINNDHFDLQKSSDGAEFSILSEIKGAGTSTSVHNYEYIDPAPFSGYTYYRLRQTDYDGASTLSHVVSVKSEGKIKIYPNPAKTHFLVEDEGIENAEIVFINSLGQRVFAKSTAQPNQVTFETGELPRGVYVMLISLHGKVVTQKIILE